MQMRKFFSYIFSRKVKFSENIHIFPMIMVVAIGANP